MKPLRWFGAASLVAVILAGVAWAFGALYYDGPSKLFAAAQVVAILAVFVIQVPRQIIKIPLAVGDLGGSVGA